MKLLKIAAVLATSFCTMTSFAKTEEDTNKKTKRTLHNPLNGKDYVKEKEKVKVKNAHGETEVEAVKKSTIDKNGHVEKEKIDIEGESTNKDH